MNWLKLGIIKISPWHFKQLRWLSGVLWITLDSWPWQSYGMSHDSWVAVSDHPIRMAYPMTLPHYQLSWTCNPEIHYGLIVIFNVFLWWSRIIFAWRFCGFVFSLIFIFQHFFQSRFDFCFFLGQMLKNDFKVFVIRTPRGRRIRTVRTFNKNNYYSRIFNETKSC